MRRTRVTPSSAARSLAAADSASTPMASLTPSSPSALTTTALTKGVERHRRTVR